MAGPKVDNAHPYVLRGSAGPLMAMRTLTGVLRAARLGLRVTGQPVRVGSACGRYCYFTVASYRRGQESCQ